MGRERHGQRAVGERPDVRHFALGDAVVELDGKDLAVVDGGAVEGVVWVVGEGVVGGAAEEGGEGGRVDLGGAVLVVDAFVEGMACCGVGDGVADWAGRVEGCRAVGAGCAVVV